MASLTATLYKKEPRRTPATSPGAGLQLSNEPLQHVRAAWAFEPRFPAGTTAVPWVRAPRAGGHLWPDRPTSSRRLLKTHDRQRCGPRRISNESTQCRDGRTDWRRPSVATGQGMRRNPLSPAIDGSPSPCLSSSPGSAHRDHLLVYELAAPLRRSCRNVPFGGRDLRRERGAQRLEGGRFGPAWPHRRPFLAYAAAPHRRSPRLAWASVQGSVAHWVLSGGGSVGGTTSGVSRPRAQLRPAVGVRLRVRRRRHNASAEHKRRQRDRQSLRELSVGFDRLDQRKNVAALHGARPAGASLTTGSRAVVRSRAGDAPNRCSAPRASGGPTSRGSPNAAETHRGVRTQ